MPVGGDTTDMALSLPSIGHDGSTADDGIDRGNRLVDPEDAPW